MREIGSRRHVLGFLTSDEIENLLVNEFAALLRLRRGGDVRVPEGDVRICEWMC